eukprot:COSAG02_NODE_33080_length_505_cov_7.096059_1_plen_82_part_00
MDATEETVGKADTHRSENGVSRQAQVQMEKDTERLRFRWEMGMIVLSHPSLLTSKLDSYQLLHELIQRSEEREWSEPRLKK